MCAFAKAAGLINITLVRTVIWPCYLLRAWQRGRARGVTE